MFTALLFCMIDLGWPNQVWVWLKSLKFNIWLLKLVSKWSPEVVLHINTGMDSFSGKKEKNKVRILLIIVMDSKGLMLYFGLLYLLHSISLTACVEFDSIHTTWKCSINIDLMLGESWVSYMVQVDRGCNKTSATHIYIGGKCILCTACSPRGGHGLSNHVYMNAFI